MERVLRLQPVLLEVFKRRVDVAQMDMVWWVGSVD